MSTEDKKKLRFGGPTENVVEVSLFAVILLSVLSLLLIFASAALALGVEFTTEPRPSKVVLRMFEDLVTADYQVDTLEEILPNYLVTSEDGLFDWSGEYPSDWTAFRRTFWNHGQTPKSFEVVASDKDYVELQLYDADSQPLYPRVAFFYQLSDDKTKIADYTLCRLEPFSRYDEEYNEEWLLK